MGAALNQSALTLTVWHMLRTQLFGKSDRRAGRLTSNLFNNHIKAVILCCDWDSDQSRCCYRLQLTANSRRPTLSLPRDSGSNIGSLQATDRRVVANISVVLCCAHDWVSLMSASHSSVERLLFFPMCNNYTKAVHFLFPRLPSV